MSKEQVKQLDVSLLSQPYTLVKLKEIDLADGRKFNRIISEARVKKILESFDPVAFNPPVLYLLDKPKGPEEDIIYGILDGQHGVSGLKISCDPETIIQARIIDDNTPGYIVEKFKTVNENKRCVNETEKFWADNYVRNPECVAIKRIITGNNIPIEKRKRHNIPAIVNVGRLRQIYQTCGEEIFSKAFDVIKGSFWDKEFVQIKAIENYFILAVIQFCQMYPDCDPKIFKKYSAAEIEVRSNSCKGGHKNARILAVLKRIYRAER